MSTAGAPPVSRVVAATVDERGTVLRTIGLFERAGLQPPPLEIRIGTLDGCNGHVAIHRHRDGIGEIERCATGATGTEHILLHELGHAWVALNVDAEEEQRFRSARGWNRWNDRADAWRDRSTEQVAEVITWGVYDLVAPIMIDHDGADDLADSCRILTGVDPVEPRAAACDRAVGTEPS